MADDKIDMKTEVYESPSIINAINNMKKRGYAKDTAVRLTGAPYEGVDRVWRADEPKKKEEK